MVSKNRLQR